MGLHISNVSWKPGFPSRGVDAQAVYEVIESLGDEKTPEKLLKVSKAKKAVCHPLFEWDDGKAAEAHRLEQSRGIFRSLTFEYCVKGAPEPLVTRVYERTVVPPGEGLKKAKRTMYAKAPEVMADAAGRSKLLADAMNDLRIFRRRYMVLQELAELIEVVDDLLGDDAA